jgi:uncharacterized small protein (DUF1192 family)
VPIIRSALTALLDDVRVVAELRAEVERLRAELGQAKSGMSD